MRIEIANLPIRAVDSAVSAEAAILRKEFSELAAAELGSAALGAPVERLRQELHEAAQEASVDDWDGYGAQPADAGALQYATILIPSLPRAYGEPAVDIEPDGEVSFEWHADPRHTFSFSVGPSGKLSYAGLLGHRSFFGTEYFVDELPSAILEGLRRVLGRRR